MKAQDFRDSTAAELREKLAKFKEEQFNLKMQLSLGQLESNQRIQAVRRDIARLMTVIGEKKVAEEV